MILTLFACYSIQNADTIPPRATQQRGLASEIKHQRTAWGGAADKLAMKGSSKNLSNENLAGFACGIRESRSGTPDSRQVVERAARLAEPLLSEKKEI
jgi:hypothetical protein